jgi:hypothetical protein
VLISETGGFASPPDGGFALYAAAIETGTNRLRKVSVNTYKVSPNTYRMAARVIELAEKAWKTRQK